ncbi:nose resistant to fluoxetine protein 6-like [Rhopalosiphum maidis]|uniref:nose resistant to fluoxetine protein 6-like n=1 Tax=Rhopalosiphum maidis TaxID=43146 RepID=UPI000EFE6C6B|nr:nose resistant to fluoxetine protein 6-like [Rhopalosiphum maidis]
MKTLLWSCCWALMFASVLRPSLSTPATTNSTSAEQHARRLHDVGTSRNSTAITASSPAEDGGDDSGRAADSGELTGGDRGEDDGGGGASDADGSATDGGRVSELYEDLEDSVVFEDSDSHGRDGGKSVDDVAADHQPLTDAGPVPAAAETSESSASAEEYDAAADDASPAGTSPVGHVLQRSVKYPEYVRSSSYRRGWSGGNVTRPEELFRFWDPYEWTATPAVSPQCAEHVQLYQEALRNGKMWAFKMSDASGHYSSGYFWGNTFWLGSKSLCTEISEYDKELPFKLGFNIIKTYIALKAPINYTERYQHLGLCMPYSCSKEDVDEMVNQTLHQDIPERDVKVAKVKSPHDYYDLFNDRVFWLLVIISATTAVFLIIGTSLDVYLEKNNSNKMNGFMFDNYRYAVSSAKLQPLSEHSKIDLESESSKSSENLSKAQPMTCTAVNMLLAFSVRRNLRQICDKSIGEDTISTVHGLRSLSMVWIVLGHVCIVSFKYSDNMEFRTTAERHLLFQLINKATFSVDTFFFISGLLVSFLYFRTTAKVDVNKLTKTTGFLSNFIEFIGLLIYRFCRLTAPYFFALGVVQLTMKWFHYNSVFDPPTDDHLNCPKYWWRNLLYINTLFPVQDMCMLWSWYLADDTQFYILGVILLILSVRYFKAAAVILVFCTIASWFTTGYIAYTNKHMPNIDDPLALFDKIYDKPWTRLGPYFVGMSIGWLLFKTECKIKMNTLIVITGWTVSSAVLCSLIFGLHQMDLHPVAAAAYSSLSHTLWALCLSWTVIACATGHGGYINKLLSCKILIPFSRTTYCAYLVHPIIIRYVIMKRDTPLHLTVETVAILFLGQIVVSYLFAFILSIAFEAPIVSLLKLVSPTKRNNH